MAKHKDYKKFRDYLIYSNQDVVKLTFKQIEELLGEKFSQSYLIHRANWSNNERELLASKCWLPAGYRSFNVNMSKRVAYFKKQDYVQNEIILDDEISEEELTLFNESCVIPDNILCCIEEGIQEKINRFYSSIKDYKEGGPNTRYKSWEWCHKFFLEHKNKNDEESIELMSVHLAFYLASWGMYRGSSYLLQRDYKAHKNAVKYIIDKRYETLWNYVPTRENILEAVDLLFNREYGIYWLVKNSYSNYDDNDDDASDTLTTKILMGTFGCVPAFDRYLKGGIVSYNKTHRSGITQIIEDQGSKTFINLCKFAITNKNELSLQGTEIYYPPMKCVDMYFWEIGYELDLAKELVNPKNSTERKDKLLNKAIELGLCTKGMSYIEVCNEIRGINNY